MVRPLSEIAQLLESTDEAESRVRRALHVLRDLVRYECCALLEAHRGTDGRVTAEPPEAPLDAVGGALRSLFSHVSGQKAPSPGPLPATLASMVPFASHLAVPLIWRDEVRGLLFVGRAAAGKYDAQDLAALAVVASQLATYLATIAALEEVNSARAEAEAANRIKDEFLATLSHELRTPLNAIVGWAHVLSTGNLNEATAQRAVETILRNARQQTQLIADMLDVSRIVSGKLRLEVRSLELGDVLESAVESVRPAAEAKEVRIDARVSQGLGPIIGDADRLLQIFWNLLSNAIKFTPRGGLVQVSILRVGTEIEVTVTDTGEGIDPAFLPYVFERFRQGDASAQRRHGGLGLGLAIVKHLVDMHGGTVSAASTGLGQGSRFTVRLPIRSLASWPPPVVPPTAHPPDAMAGPGVMAGKEPTPSRPLAALRVVAVDDDRDCLDLVALTLRQVGAEVFPAASAAEALDLLAEQPVDLLVADIQMPDEDGYALMRKVRARPPRQGGAVRAAALSASVGREEVSRALQAGYEIHIAKPVEPGELTAAIARLLGR